MTLPYHDIDPVGDYTSSAAAMTAHTRLISTHRSFTQRISFERLPTNTTTYAHPVHRWFNFIAGFSPEFVQACIAMCYDGERRSILRVLDPFVGCGTVATQARILGHASTGYDPHPFFHLISEAKANSARYWPLLSQIERSIRDGLSNPASANEDLTGPAALFLGKMFQSNDLNALIGARRALEESDLATNPLAVLALSRILDHCCFAATDGIYKAPTSTKKTLTPELALRKVMATLLSDSTEAVAGKAETSIFCKSSEKMEELDDRSVDLVITSPPYLNNFDFAEMTRMYLYFWHVAESWSEITQKVRSRLITNTTTALKGHREAQGQYRVTLPSSLSTELEDVVEQLRHKKTLKAGKKDYDLLVYPYLSQMHSVLKECFRVMSRGSPLHMIISDAALYGVHLHAPQWVAHIMKEVGFTDVECRMVRPRGHRWVLNKREGTKDGLGEYYVFGRVS